MLFEQLEQLRQSDWYPMHMPGHKRKEQLCPLGNPYGLDITEIDGFDNLHDAEGILKESMEYATKLFHAEETKYLVGGSTAGILIGISACTKRNDKILVARNCHRAVYHAIEQMELTPVYLYPALTSLGFPKGITANIVMEALEEHTDCKLVVITSPTYEGILSEVKEIAEVVHQKGIPLLVDEAHGAHLGFERYENANQAGADLVVQSAHKTLPAFTQSALLHRNGTLVNVERLQHYFTIYQTSSPSYLLMGSLDAMVQLLQQQGTTLFAQYYENLDWFYREVKKCKNILLYTGEEEYLQKDSGKLIFYAKYGKSGQELYNRLREQYHIQPEMAGPNYVLCMSTVADTREDFLRLLQAITEMDSRLLDENETIAIPTVDYEVCAGTQRKRAREAFDAKWENVELVRSIGRICADYVGLYPPGIPILVAGEEITKKAVDTLMECEAVGLHLFGVTEKQIRVMKAI